MAERWMRVGTSDDSSPREAGRVAARDADGDLAALLVVLASPSVDAAELLGGIREIAPRTPLIGCTTAGEIATTGPATGSVVIASLGGPGFRVHTAHAPIVDTDTRAAGRDVANQLLAEATGATVMVLADALGGDQQALVRGLYDVLGAGVPIVGGCAGDDLQMRHTLQFHGDDVLQHSVVGAVIRSNGPVGIGVRHGWRRVGHSMVVSEADGATVIGLDDRPALDVYLEALGAPADVAENRAELTRFALTHPLGIERLHGEEIRFISGADTVARTLQCLATVPVGAVVHLMEGDRDSVLDATTEAASEAVTSLQGAPPIGAIAFDCIARKGVLEDAGIDTEVARMVEHVGAPIVGFYTYGEIARVSGPRGFHNQTLVVAAFG